MTKKKHPKKASHATKKTSDTENVTDVSVAKKVHTKSKNIEEEWYQKPTTWIIAVLVIAVFILILRDSVDLNSSMRPPVSGDGQIIIQEFVDFNCPACMQAQTVVNQLKEIYGDSVIFEIRHFPFQGPTSQAAAEAVECARDQGVEEAFKNLLYANFREYSDAQLKQHAVTLNLDTVAFNTCLDSGAKSSVIEADRALARSLGVSATPTFIVNGESIRGALPLAEFRAVIDRHLQSSSASTETPSTQPTPDVPDFSNDPVIELVVLNDQNCITCETDNIIAILKGELFPTIEVREVDISSSEGQSLVSEYTINALPAFLFDSVVSDAASFSNLYSEGVLVQNQDLFEIPPYAIGTTYFLTKPVVTAQDHVYGDFNAPITIVEYSDFTCIFCGYASGLDATNGAALKQRDPSWTAAVPEIKRLADEGHVRFVYKHFVINEQGVLPVLASECAAEQDAFWEYHDVIFANQQRVMEGLSTQGYVQFAQDIGLDTASFEQCLTTKDVSSLIDAHMTEARAFGISGTPSFMVENYLLEGVVPFREFQALLTLLAN